MSGEGAIAALRTANALARDLERYLATTWWKRPPSAGYRLRKLLRKHRVAISTVAAFVGLLIAADGIGAVLAIKARRGGGGGVAECS